MRYCSRCGKLSDTDAPFCEHCGKGFGGNPDVIITKPEEAEAENSAIDYEKAEEIRSGNIPEGPVIDEETGDSESSETEAEKPEGEAELDEYENYRRPLFSEKPVPVGVRSRVLGIIGLALSAQSFAICYAPGYNFITLLLSITGLVFCCIACEDKEYKLARIGRIISIIAVAASLISIIVWTVIIFRNAAEAVENALIDQDFSNVLNDVLSGIYKK